MTLCMACIHALLLIFDNFTYWVYWVQVLSWLTASSVIDSIRRIALDCIF
jgi:hypothetical protein